MENWQIHWVPGCPLPALGSSPWQPHTSKGERQPGCATSEPLSKTAEGHPPGSPHSGLRDWAGT
eukprot:6672807-Prorocentrum_lima.AAC.1